LVLERSIYTPLKDGNPVLAAYTVRNLRRKALVVHQQELEITDIVYQQLLEPIGKKVTSLLVRAVPDLWHAYVRINAHPTHKLELLAVTYLGHRQLTLEPSAHPVINSLRLPPCLLDRVVAVRLVAPVDMMYVELG
jgi:hypothetical protein